jgi:hypothetical protein
MQPRLRYVVYMEPKKHLTLYLNDPQRAQVEAEQPSMLGHVIAAVKRAGWKTTLVDDTQIPPEHGRAGYHLVVNKPVNGPNVVTLRKCYLDPFWRIERTNDRWDWDVTAKEFDPSRVNPERAAAFFARWQKHLFSNEVLADKGYVFVPLQGKLAIRRHFQEQSPLDMIMTTLQQDPLRDIIATLHPREIYQDHELAVLKKLELSHPRFRLSQDPSIGLLAGCSYVVTQNSSLALKGFFAKKPAILFAKIDFHHIAENVGSMGSAEAFCEVNRKEHAFEAYLQWFFKWHSITVWSENAVPEIQKRLRHLRWPI